MTCKYCGQRFAPAAKPQPPPGLQHDTMMQLSQNSNASSDIVRPQSVPCTELISYEHARNTHHADSKHHAYLSSDR